MKMILNIEPKPQTRPRFSKFGTYEDPKMKAWRRHENDFKHRA
nr:MAG TPA: Endodeoxyribonuclease RusA [Caudoviricetes sp.]